ncbi:MAG TPA: hypothetical protein VIE38_10490 [Gaiellaceae bacterium]|jgi:hypothetical protein
MSSRTIKKLLLSLIVVGILSTFTVGGTYAIFNGQTNNSNQTFQSGSMVMTNTVNGGTCYSDAVPANLNVNATCTTLFSTGQLYPITTATPPTLPQTTVAYADVAIASAALDAGSNPINSTLDSTLSAYMPKCDASNTAGATVTGLTNPCCPGDAFGANVLPGTNNPCPTGSLDFFIQEYTTSGFTTPKTSCVFPVSAVATCTFQDDELGSFFGQYHASSNTLSLGTLTHGTTRYFRIAVAEPIDAGNGLQGETATLSLVWHMQ